MIVKMLTLLAVTLAVGTPAICSAQDDDALETVQPSAQDMAELMAKARMYTSPSDHHKLLEKFVGEWDTEASLVTGGKKTPPEKGKATGKWMIEGRWLSLNIEGTFMSQSIQTHTTLGYDNFKQSYVSTSVSSFDTAMNRVEGDLDPETKAIVLFGTLDEYLTGEHDKAVKTVWRFPSKDEMLMEVHDLSIGEADTMVIELKFKRSGKKD